MDWLEGQGQVYLYSTLKATSADQGAAQPRHQKYQLTEALRQYYNFKPLNDTKNNTKHHQRKKNKNKQKQTKSNFKLNKSLRKKVCFKK